MKITAISILLTLALMGECFASVVRSETEKHFEGPYHITITPTQRVRAKTVKSKVRFPNLGRPGMVGGVSFAARVRGAASGPGARPDLGSCSLLAEVGYIYGREAR